MNSYEAMVVPSCSLKKEEEAQSGVLHCSDCYRQCIFVFVYKGAKWQSSCQRGNKAVLFICAEFNQEIN